MLGCFSDGGEQCDKAPAIRPSRIFLQSTRQRQMLSLTALGQPARVSGEKREWMRLIPLVFGEMEGDSTYEPPQGIFLVQIRPHAFAMSTHLDTDPGIQLEPSRPQGSCVEILQTSHRRSFEHDRG